MKRVRELTQPISNYKYRSHGNVTYLKLNCHTTTTRRRRINLRQGEETGSLQAREGITQLTAIKAVSEYPKEIG